MHVLNESNTRIKYLFSETIRCLLPTDDTVHMTKSERITMYTRYNQKQKTKSNIQINHLKLLLLDRVYGCIAWLPSANSSAVVSEEKFEDTKGVIKKLGNRIVHNCVGKLYASESRSYPNTYYCQSNHVLCNSGSDEALEYLYFWIKHILKYVLPLMIDYNEIKT